MSILNEKYFSIEFFNDLGIEKVSEATGIDTEEIIYESEIGNHLIGQAENGRYFLFCESDDSNLEISFNAFLSLLK